MRVDILTLHSVANYGTQLQALATQEKLSEYFDNVQFIDYRRPDTHGIKLIQTFSQGNLIRGLAFLPTMLAWKYRFGYFHHKYLNISSKRYDKESDFSDFKEDADCYVVGSDQVWNSGWNKGIIPTFFLDFISDQKTKFSFSSSFGKNQLNENEILPIGHYLRRFQRLSVREPSGKQIIQNQLGINEVTQLVDPVLSLSAEKWRSIAGTRKTKTNYILVYSLNNNPDFDKYAQRLAEHKKMRLIRFCTRIDQVIKPGHSKIVPNILDFVRMIDNASLVLTDSFHATAFSMLLNTPPICIYPSQYSNRISEFLRLVDQENRHLKTYEDLELSDQSVDFSKVNQILNSERIRVDKYLKAVVNDLNTADQEEVDD